MQKSGRGFLGVYIYLMGLEPLKSLNKMAPGNFPLSVIDDPRYAQEVRRSPGALFQSGERPGARN